MSRVDSEEVEEPLLERGGPGDVGGLAVAGGHETHRSEGAQDQQGGRHGGAADVEALDLPTGAGSSRSIRA